VKTDVTYDCPTSLLRGMTSTDTEGGPICCCRCCCCCCCF